MNKLLMKNIFIDNVLINLFKFIVKVYKKTLFKKPGPKDIYHK